MIKGDWTMENIKLGRVNRGLTKRFNEGVRQTIYHNQRYTLDDNGVIYVTTLGDMTDPVIYGYYIDGLAYRKAQN